MNIILAAVPMFFLLIAIELIVDRVRGTGHYRLNDAISSLSLGVFSRVTGIAKRLIPFTVYYFIFDHVSLFTLPETWWVWVFAFVFYDVLYYWLHRLSHEINVLWAAHVVHHSSEDYNLTTALRQTSGYLFNWVFFIPMAILGIPPEIFIAVGALNLVYQFWVHTQHIDQLGWMEKVFVTPSNHRVHHAQNARYIDCNYGGVFILWDRLFGTFRPECKEEPVIYGVRTPLNSWNPIWANLQVYTQLWKDAWHTKNWRDKIAIWFKPTGWRPADVIEKYPLEKTDLTKFQKFETNISPAMGWYAIAQHVLAIVLTLWLMMQVQSMSMMDVFVLGGMVTLTLFSNSQLLTARASAPQLEILKLGSLPLILMYFEVSSIWLLLAVCYNVVSIIALWYIKKHWGDVSEDPALMES